MTHLLASTTGAENDELVAKVESHSGDYAPPVLFTLSGVLLKQNKIDDALFWYNAAYLRTTFDLARCADITARPAIMQRIDQVSGPIRQLLQADLDKFQRTSLRAYIWDERTPHHYDYRWVNLAGQNAIASARGDKDVLNLPMSVPEEQWGPLAKRVRLEYMAGVAHAIKTQQMRASLAQSSAVPPTSGSLSQGSVPLQGGYASIDTRPVQATIHELLATSGNENTKLIDDIEQNSGNYPPPVFFVLASVLYRQGKLDEAIFWYNAGRLRGSFDAGRCADVSARSGVADMVMQMPAQLLRQQYDDPTKLRKIISQVVHWDETTPYHYDYRWINLHGMGAITSSLGNGSLQSKQLSLPQEQWAGIAAHLRADFPANVDIAIKKFQATQRASY